MGRVVTVYQGQIGPHLPEPLMGVQAALSPPSPWLAELIRVLSVHENLSAFLLERRSRASLGSADPFSSGVPLAQPMMFTLRAPGCLDPHS